MLGEVVTRLHNVMTVPGHVRIHTCPKNASAVVSQAMHGTEYYNRLPEEEGHEYRFMVIRHPADRMVSAWAFFCEGNISELEGQSGLKNLGYYYKMPFHEFFLKAVKLHNYNQHTRKQSVFAGPHHIDWVCPIENLQENWEKLREQFPVLVNPIQHNHRSRHENWRKYFNNKMLIEVEQTFKEDMELYEQRRN